MVSDDVGYPPSSLTFAAATRPSGSLKPSSLADFLGDGQNDYFGPVGLAPSEKLVKVPKRNPTPPPRGGSFLCIIGAFLGNGKPTQKMQVQTKFKCITFAPTKWNVHKNAITNFEFIQVSRCIEGVPGGSHRHNRCHPYASLVAGVGAEPSTCPAFARFP